MLKRSGLDYSAPIEQIDDLEAYLEKSQTPFYFYSSHATRLYTEVDYTPNDLLIFGSETSGLPKHFFENYPDRFVTLPMVPGARCLNLSNTVAIALYEADRQLNYIN